ncbi:hypothetical protein ACFOD8_00095 [Arthrobacter agilis]|uniref:hypothetical protein n=1 Tax=Arthrobacter agilis TaxID=37921 RepID=UPI003617C116
MDVLLAGRHFTDIMSIVTDTGASEEDEAMEPDGSLPKHPVTSDGDTSSISPDGMREKLR